MRCLVVKSLMLTLIEITYLNSASRSDSIKCFHRFCAINEAVQEPKEESMMLGGLGEPQAKAEDDSDIEDVSPAVDIPPPPPVQMDEQPGFADFGEDAPLPPAPSPGPPPRPPQPDFTESAAQAPSTAPSQEKPKESLETPAANIAIPRPTTPRSSSPGIVLPPPIAPPKETPESMVAPAPATEATSPQQPPKQEWEGGFENNFSDLGLAAEVKTTTDVDAAFTPIPPETQARVPSPVPPQAQPEPQTEPETKPELEPQPEAQVPPRVPSPLPEPERAKSPCLATCRTFHTITACCYLHSWFTFFRLCEFWS